MGPEAQKARGAYYTHPIIARFLLRFAVPTPDARVLDPCFGEAVFLRAAIERLRHLGGDPAKQVTGIEVDPQVHRAISIELTRSGLLGRRALHRKDFFEVDATTGMGRFTAVVGNPPFIRYQRFSGSQREMALKRALQAGVRLTALTSSWAPFIVHATTFLETG